MFYVRWEVGKETSSQQTSKHYRRTTHPKSKENGTKEVLVPNEGDNFIFHFLTVPRSWHEKVLKSENPTDFGKTSKMEKNSAVIFKEKRTIQILQSNNENKANWKQYVISGLNLEAPFLVIMCKTDKNCMCHREARFRSHSSILMWSGGHALHWTYCKNFRMIIGSLMVIGYYYQDNGPVSPSSQYWIQLHLKGTRGPWGDWRRFRQVPGPKTYGQKFDQVCQRKISKKKNSIGQKKIKSSIQKVEGSGYGRCNSVQITKELRKLILEGATGSTKGKSRWTLARRDPLLSPPREKGSRVYQEAHTRDSKQRSRRSHCRRMKEREWILWVIEILCTNRFLCSRQWRFHLSRPQRTNNGISLWKFQRGKNEKLKSKQEVMKQCRQAKRFILQCSWHNAISKSQNWKTVSNIQRTCCTARRRCE